MKNNIVLIPPSDRLDDDYRLMIEVVGDEVFLTIYDHKQGFDFTDLNNGKSIGVSTQRLLDGLVAANAAKEIIAIMTASEDA